MSEPSVQAAWSQVEQAETPKAQSAAIEAFMSALSKDGSPPKLQVAARRLDTGAAAPIGPDLMAKPEEHEVIVRAHDRSFRFRPLSEDSLAPLLRE